MIGKLTSLMGYAKAPKTTYLLKHPIKGPKNLLALRGARSLLEGKGAAIAGAGLAIGAAAIPLALRIKRRKAR